MTNNTISLRSLLEKEKLNGTNFLDWFRNLRIVLKQERKEFVIEKPIPMNQLLMHLELTKTTYGRHSWCRMSYACHHESRALEATRGYGRNWYDQKKIHERQARQKRYETSEALFQCMMTKRSPVGAHVINDGLYPKRWKGSVFPLKDEVATDLILQSLSDRIKPFIINFNMIENNKTLP